MQPFDTFPLPEPKPSEQAVQQRLQLQHDVMMGPLTSLITGLDERLAAQGSQAKALSSRLKKSVASRINTSARTMQPAVTTLMNAIGESIAQQGAKIAMFPAAPDPVPIPPVGPGPAQQIPCSSFDAQVNEAVNEGYVVVWKCDPFVVSPERITAYGQIAGMRQQGFKIAAWFGGPGADDAADQFITLYADRMADCCTANQTIPPGPIPPPVPVVIDPPVIPPGVIPPGWHLCRDEPPPDGEPPVPFDPHGGIFYKCHPHFDMMVRDVLTVEIWNQIKADGWIEWQTYVIGDINDANAIAFANIGTMAALCPVCPPPPPDGDKLPVPDNWACNIANMFPQGMEIPGSAEYCKLMDQAVRHFEEFGKMLFGFMDYLLGDNDTQDISLGFNYAPGVVGSITFGFMPDFVKGLKWIRAKAKAWISTIWDTIKCMLELGRRMLPTRYPDALAAVWATKWVLNALRHIEWGTDALAWLVNKLEIVFPQIEKELDYIMEYICPLDSPTVEEALEAYLRDYIPRDRLECIMAIHGRDPKSHWPMAKARSEKITPKEAIQYVRRQGGGPADEKAWLRKLGWIDDQHTEAFQELYWELPTIGDHLEWLRKNVFDTDYVKDFQLMDNFEEKFWPRFGKDLETLGMKKENAALHYAAHWLNPSFAQLFEMTQRLRPGRNKDGLTFQTNDLLRVMQEMDVGVYFRKRLEAVSHPAPNLTMVLAGFANHVYGEDEFKEKLKDLGYAAEDTEWIAKTRTFESRRQRASSGRGFAPMAISNLLMFGYISNEEAKERMKYLGYDDTEADDLIKRANLDYKLRINKQVHRRVLFGSVAAYVDAYSVGTLDKTHFRQYMGTLGVSDEVIESYANLIDTKGIIALYKEEVKSFKSAVMSGRMTVQEANAMMKRSGMPDEKADKTTASWTIQLSARNPHATAAKLLSWVAQGIMPMEVARDRLSRMGWADPDLMLLLAETRMKQAKGEAANAQKVMRTREQAVKAAMKQVKDLKDQQKKIQNEARRQITARGLQTWYAEHLIDEQELHDELVARGYSESNAQKYIDEAKEKREKYDAKKAKEDADKQAKDGE